MKYKIAVRQQRHRPFGQCLQIVRHFLRGAVVRADHHQRTMQLRCERRRQMGAVNPRKTGRHRRRLPFGNRSINALVFGQGSDNVNNGLHMVLHFRRLSVFLYDSYAGSNAFMSAMPKGGEPV